MDKDYFAKILEEMPLRLSCKLKIGENDYALKMVRKMEGNEDATMEGIQLHNAEAKGWDDGWKAAMEEIRKWRNEQYLKLKNLS